LICDTPAASAAAAVAALPELRDVRLTENWDLQRKDPFAAAQFPTGVTHLSLGLHNNEEALEHLSQLSGLVNLEHLELLMLDPPGVPGGLPSQLVKLTCLDMYYSDLDAAEQFQHLSALTALQQLKIVVEAQVNPFGGFSGIAHLAQLTSLELIGFDLSSEDTTTWTRLTALHRLAATLQPSALPPLAQLQSLFLGEIYLPDRATLEGFLVAVCQLTLLTELEVGLNVYEFQAQVEQQQPPLAAFTALTASTHLRSLHVEFGRYWAAPELFRPDTRYPHLRQIRLDELSPSEQQLQRMCSCCLGLNSAAFVLDGSVAATACLPLLQLSALANLEVRIRGASADTAKVLLGVAAQLTGLRSLSLQHERDLVMDHPPPGWQRRVVAAHSIDSPGEPHSVRVPAAGEQGMRRLAACLASNIGCLPCIQHWQPMLQFATCMVVT
jgi:hypothetical protein